MGLTIPENIKTAVNNCKNLVNDFVVTPGLYLGKKIVYMMLPRERLKGENFFTYAGKEAVVLVAKAILIVASANFLKAAACFSIYSTSAVVLFLAARHIQIRKNWQSLGLSLQLLCTSANAFFNNLRNLKTV